MDYGGKAEKAFRKLASRGIAVKALTSRPELPEDLERYWTAFHECSSRRQCGMGPSPIQISEILAWLDLHGYADPWVRRSFFVIVCRLDAEWMKRHGGSDAGGPGSRPRNAAGAGRGASAGKHDPGAGQRHEDRGQ